MGKAYTYTVRDLEGNIIEQKARGRDLEPLLGDAAYSLTSHAYNNYPVNGKYYVEIDGEVTTSKRILETILISEWENAVGPFRRVMWVKKDGIGVKKLRLPIQRKHDKEDEE
ncbi:MAG: hypothetical protein LUH55_00755 [Bacteroides thetaiotaomicron]|nr:hypothetical protein [Bacteroides thetaiotaomicron]